MQLKKSQVLSKDRKQESLTFLFLGPTGVGKTELTKQLAGFVFGNSDSLIKVDMSELMEGHSVSKLIGSPPGYVGYEEGGSLTEQVRHNPYSIVLFDEIEKAHSDIFNILLQILDDGKVTDSKGRVVNFKNTIIILTSNIGTEISDTMNKIGFEKEQKTKKVKSDKEKYQEVKNKAIENLKNYFKPEFLNRLDEIVVFEALSEKTLEKIVKLELDVVSERLKEKNIDLKVTKKAIDELINDDYPKEFGARPIRRIIQENILDNLSDQILKNYEQKGVFTVDFKNKEFVFDFKVSKSKISTRRKSKLKEVVKKAV
ncbi:hypothetical protein CSB11_02450 [Candidatus Campbellbacteria bacterium]|nr:MAG: hypothetical protein CSB11_02450 [Candidatus Campbellbacteria bacterium]